ncbi:MAG: hypothetical protein Aurels2KO_16600 [Aureliella sp.]
MNEPLSTDAERAIRGKQHETLPPPAEWSAAAVRLLQGVIYNDDSHSVWETLLRNVSPLTDYFAKLGLQLIVDETSAMAYLRQPDDDVPAEYQSVPRLFRRSQLSYDVTLLCVLLRDELRRYEEEDLQNERCVVSQSELLEVWKNFFPDEDEVKRNRQLTTGLRKLEDLKFVRQFEKDPPSWEVRRIIKARLPLSELERIRQSLVAAAQDAAKKSAASENQSESPQ